METRRETVRRIDAMTVKVTRVSGRLLVGGQGEGSVDVPFPVEFVERPIFNFGGELDVNHRATAGRYPSVSAVIVDWVIIGANNGTEGHFKGATLAVTSRGTAGQKMWIHYTFEGKALRNPLNATDATDQAL